MKMEIFKYGKMEILKYGKNFLLTVLAALLLVACTASDDTVGGGTAELSSMPVCISSGTSEGTITSRATADYMPQNGRFVCRMYYQGAAASTDYNAYTEAWLTVNNAKGNCVYRKNTFVEPETDVTDDYGFDKEASIFYWQNRKPHIFIGLADYNKLTTDVGTTSGTLQMPEPQMVFDIRRTENMTSVADQQDIIQAHAVVTPSGATSEANRVSLYFKHCFAKVQVNIKPSKDGGLDDFTADNIDKVELLGIADTAFVYNINVSDTLEAYDTTYVAPEAKPVLATNYTKEQLAENPYLTCIEMFKADSPTSGYTTTHDVITFGNIQAIRVTWHETKDNIQHVMTKKVTDEQDKVLKSGYRHIFNMELRRGTLALVNAEIKAWETGTTYDNIDGTIKK